MNEYPTSISIESTRLCNLRCTMCPTHSANADPQIMKKYPPYFDWDRYKDIINQLAEFKTPLHVSPQFQGEPLLNNNIFAMVRLAKEKGFATGFSTNGLLLGREYAQLVIDSGLDSLTVSMDGVSKGVFEKIRVGANYDNIVWNVENFLKLRQGRPSVAINGVRMPENAQEIDRLVSRWLPLVDQVSISNVWHDTGVSKKYFLPKRYPCPSLWQNMIILTNGDVIPCCNPKFDHVMGNVFKQTVLEVWNGDMYTTFRSLHQQAKWHRFPCCVQCDTWMTSSSKKRVENGYLVDVHPFHKIYTKGAPVSRAKQLWKWMKEWNA